MWRRHLNLHLKVRKCLKWSGIILSACGLTTCVWVDFIKANPGYDVFELLNPRGNFVDIDEKTFFWFFDTVVSCVAGKRRWTPTAKVSLTITGSKLVSVTDEAFAELLIENYYARWRGTGLAKWTDSRGDNVDCRAWSPDAVRRFNEVCRRIQQQRRHPQNDAVEQKFRDLARQKYDRKPVEEPGRETLDAFVDDDY